MRSFFEGYKSVVLREAAITAHADWYSNYIDLQGWNDPIIEVEVAADAALDGANYWELFLMSATASPTASGSYSAVSAGDVDLESVATATGVSTVTKDSGTNAVKIDSTGEDSVLLRYRYKGTARYLCVFGDVTTAGAAPTGVIGVKAHLGHPREHPANTQTPTTGTVT